MGCGRIEGAEGEDKNTSSNDASPDALKGPDKGGLITRCTDPAKNVLEPALTSAGLSLFATLLLWGAFSASGSDPVMSRTTCLSCLLSPPGTLLRWRLSRYNGAGAAKLLRGGGRRRRGRRCGVGSWLPLGTLVANLVASAVSLLAVAFSLRLVDPANHPAKALLSAVKGGFAGSLSAVSTYAAETASLLSGPSPRGRARGYAYSVGSLAAACVLGVSAYAWAVV